MIDIFGDNVLIHDHTTAVGLEAGMLSAMIPTAKTKGKTFVLDEQIISPDTDVKISEVRPGKVYLPRFDIKIKIVIGDIKVENIEEKYNHSEIAFSSIALGIMDKLMEKLKNGRGIFHQFLIMTQSSGIEEITFSRQCAIVWSEEIIGWKTNSF